MFHFPRFQYQTEASTSLRNLPQSKTATGSSGIIAAYCSSSIVNYPESTDLKLPKLIATSVVRGSQQGESHGGVYTIDFETQSYEQHIDWNTMDIDWAGRGADRGLRGIAFHGDNIYIAGSDQLFCYNRDFSLKFSKRNRYLAHCHEICRWDRTLFLTSTGHDSLLAFDLDQEEFVWGFHLLKVRDKWSGFSFDPLSNAGPGPHIVHHINMAHVNQQGIFLSGLRMDALLHINQQGDVSVVCKLPLGTHNVRPFGNGIILNDTANDCVRYVSTGGKQQVFPIKTYEESQLQFAGVDDSNIARQGFGRGLCVYEDRILAGGFSPSTISLYDLQSGETLGSLNLTMDIRNAIHGLEVWPYTD